MSRDSLELNALNEAIAEIRRTFELDDEAAAELALAAAVLVLEELQTSATAPALAEAKDAQAKASERSKE